MSEMSDMFKLVNQMELAKKARVGTSLTYFDVIELLGEINSLYEYIDELESAQRWRVVADGELPEIEDGDSKDYDVVLTYPFRRDVIVATWSYDALDKTHRRRWFDCSSDEWGPDDITEYVTHWRERPTPPEVQE